ncbi:MAG: hypothetical protein EON56_04560 [Alphaproteobacteria bacterium]|nr:MAG: hypothetical protein EON56_04560 [Alphaproteobacteria bacterium]
MEKVRAHLSEFPSSQRREILYFLVRYFKQSHHLEKAGKNVFDDVFARTPDPKIYDATLAIISIVEASYGKPANQFDGRTSYKVIDQLTEIDREIDDEPSQNDLERASAFFQKI